MSTRSLFFGQCSVANANWIQLQVDPAERFGMRLFWLAHRRNAYNAREGTKATRRGSEKEGSDVKKTCLYVGALALVAVASTASATIPLDIMNEPIRFEAANINGFGFFEVSLEDGNYDPDQGLFSWQLDFPTAISTTGGLDLATLESATLELEAGPGGLRAGGVQRINWSFSVRAGNADTDFVIQSALLTFPTIASAYAEGRASSGVTATDANGNGVEMVGIGAGGTPIYKAAYNGWWTDPGQELFTGLHATVMAGPGGTGGSFQNFPMSGMEPISDDVVSMASQVAFTLTAEDIASGTNNFEIVPEPASAALIAIGAIAFLRRRR
jgi:hypothetical protein